MMLQLPPLLQKYRLLLGFGKVFASCWGVFGMFLKVVGKAFAIFLGGFHEEKHSLKSASKQQHETQYKKAMRHPRFVLELYGFVTGF